MPWSTLTFDFWRKMAAAARVLADSQGLCSKEVAQTREHYAVAMATGTAMVMVMVMVMAIVYESARRTENAMET